MKFFIAMLEFFAVAIVFGLVGYAHAQTAPTIPTGLTVATTTAIGQVTISWTAPAATSTTAGYYVYRNGARITATADTSYIDSGLSAGFYSYAVSMYDANGNEYTLSAPVTISIVTTSDTTPPSVPTGVTVTGATSTNYSLAQIPVTISWTASTDNVGVAGYDVYRSGTLIVSSSPAFTATTFTDTVYPGAYSYTVAAYDAAGNVSGRSTPVTISILIDNTAPSTPTNLFVRQASASTVNLSWASSTYNVAVAGYQVYRNGTQIASSTGASYTDSGLSAGTTYNYTVAAYDAAGNVSGESAASQIYMQSVNGPGAPSALAATLSGTSSVALSWVRGGDVVPISSYTIDRNGSQVATVSLPSYLDQNLATGTYAYTVSETDSTGAISSSSATTTVTVPPFVPGAASALPIVTTSPSAPMGSSAGSSGAQTSGVTTKITFTQYLYFGLRSAQVKALQTTLAGLGYLPSVDATGYFGAITLHAVEQFQCKRDVVCTGGAGYGTVGPKTRAALNSL